MRCANATLARQGPTDNRNRGRPRAGPLRPGRRRPGRTPTQDRSGVEPVPQRGHRRRHAGTADLPAAAARRQRPRPCRTAGRQRRLRGAARRLAGRPGDRPEGRQDRDRRAGPRRHRRRRADRRQPPHHRAGLLRAAAAAVLLRDHGVRAGPGGAAQLRGPDQGDATSTGPPRGAFVPLADPDRGPADVATATVDGRPVPYIVRARARHHRPRRLRDRRPVRRHRNPSPIAAGHAAGTAARLHLRRRLQRRLPPGRAHRRRGQRPVPVAGLRGRLVQPQRARTTTAARSSRPRRR